VQRQHETTFEAGGDIRLRVWDGEGASASGAHLIGPSSNLLDAGMNARVRFDGEISFNFNFLLVGRLSPMCGAITRRLEGPPH
jgi:hypothetical protein